MKAGRLILIVCLACALAAAGALTYKRWPGIRKVKPGPANSSNQKQFSSVPPFATKEPDRYRATRIVTSVGGDSDPAPPSVTRVVIARDGDKRREDYDSDTDFQTIYLETPAGTFALLPSKRLYAAIKPASGSHALVNQRSDRQSGQQSDSGEDFSPGVLLNEPPAARYEKLGSEKLDGRTTTKYRVTNEMSTTGTAAPTVTLIWIDETLGMPIRSETESSDGNHHSKLTIELRDIELQVDAKLFELPKDFQRVEDSELRDWLKQIRVGAGREAPKP